jgi:sodium pump decarboxylase gamma subunit
MNLLLSVSPEQFDQPIRDTLGWAEALGFGGQMLLLGMGAVFSVLGIIWALLTVFKIVFTKAPAKEKKPKEKAESIPQQVPVYTTSDSEIVAVISAAIAMAESECGDNVKFRVVSFKRK